MLSSVLHSKRAIQVNIQIMDTFVRIRQLLGTHRDLARKLDQLEKKYDAWQNHDLPDIKAKAILCDAFVAGELPAPKHLARVVHQQYFEPELEDFQPRNLWSLQNAFTTAFKQLDPIPPVQGQRRSAGVPGQVLEKEISTSERKVVCIQYETGKTVKCNGKTYPETRLLNVGSAFLTEEEGKWRISGQFRAIPPQWDGRFVFSTLSRAKLTNRKAGTTTFRSDSA